MIVEFGGAVLPNDQHPAVGKQGRNGPLTSVKAGGVAFVCSSRGKRPGGGIIKFRCRRLIAMLAAASQQDFAVTEEDGLLALAGSAHVPGIGECSRVRIIEFRAVQDLIAGPSACRDKNLAVGEQLR